MTKSLKDVNFPMLIADDKEHFILVVQEKLEVGYGSDEDVDLEYCATNGIPTYNEQRVGGTIVFSPGNVHIGCKYNNKVRGAFRFQEMLRDLTKYLQEKNLEAQLDGNDILVDGYKVASYMGYNFGEKYHWTYEGVQISVNQNIDAIRHICKKEMVKIPKGLSEFGITTDEIVEWCKRWCHTNINITEEEV